MTNELVKIKASDYGLEETKAQEIESLFTPMLSKMSELESEYNDILQNEINPETCQKAHPSYFWKFICEDLHTKELEFKERKLTKIETK